MRQQNSKNYIIVITILCLALIGLSYIYTPPKDIKVEVNLNKFPEVIGEWVGKDIPLDTRTFEILNPDGLLFKEYTNKAGEKVQLVIVLGLNKRESFHPPEVCYSGGGSIVEDKGLDTINLADNKELEVNKLTVSYKNNNFSQIALFWFTAGNSNFTNYYKQQIAIVWNEFKYRKSWGSLIRVSTAKQPEESELQAIKRMETFISEGYPLLGEFVNPG